MAELAMAVIIFAFAGRAIGVLIMLVIWALELICWLPRALWRFLTTKPE